MARSVALLLAWLVAAGASVGVAWRGVAVVGDQVVSDRPPPLTSEELGRPAPTVPSSDSASSTTTASTDPTATTSSSAADPGASPPETRTYPLVGGDVTLRFEPSGVTVVVAQPHAGFSVDREPEHGNGWKVEFESESHRSRVDGWWEGGPQEEVREEPRN